MPLMANTEQFAPKIMIAPRESTAEPRRRSSVSHRNINRGASSLRIGPFLAFVRRYRLMVGCFILLALLVLFWFAIMGRNGIRGPGVTPLTIWDAGLAIGANLIGSLILFLIVFGLLQYLKDTHREEVLTRTVVEPLKEVLREGHETACVQSDRVDWAALFAGADEVLYLAQGWDGWEKLESLPRFLDRGGKVRVILPDPDEPGLITAMARRLDRGAKEVEQEIRQTVCALQAMTNSYLGADQFSYSYTKQLSWFGGIYFKPGKLFLSFYPHQQAGNGQIESPSFLVRTDMCRGVGDWFEKEWAYLNRISSEEVRRNHQDRSSGERDRLNARL